MSKNFDAKDWQDEIIKKAEMFCQDINDRELVKADTYDHTYYNYGSIDAMTNEGVWGDWVMASAYRALADRFLMAMELIKLMEENQISGEPK